METDTINSVQLVGGPHDGLVVYRHEVPSRRWLSPLIRVHRTVGEVTGCDALGPIATYVTLTDVYRRGGDGTRYHFVRTMR